MPARESGHGPPLLEVADLTTRFHTRAGTATAVDGVSFQIDEGEFLGIVGESGSGKSATALSILGLIDPPGVIESGQVLFRGRNLVGLTEKEYRRVRGGGIALVLQDPLSALNPVMRIGAQLVETIRTHRLMTRSGARLRALELLGEVGMPDPERCLGSFPHQLSGGMRQRVAIAIALSGEPDLLIADEPTTALDVSVQAEILALLKRLSVERGLGVILITHDLAVVAGAADHVLVMYAGRVMEYGERHRLFRRPAHPYTVSLLSCLPRVDGKRSDRLPSIPGSPPRLTDPPAGCSFHPRCFLYEGRDRCREQRPLLQQVVDADCDRVACHFAEELVDRG